MSAQMKAKESLHHGLRRVCRRHVTKALKGLAKPGQAVAIHSVRKEIKTLRAVFRLSRRGLNKHDYRRIANTMQLAAKPLSAPRDALVTKQVVEKLPHAKHRALARIRSALKTYSMTEERQYEKSGASSVTGYILGRLLKATCRLKWGHFEWQDIIPCLCKSYARGRRAYLKSLRHPTSTNFHEWRKRVKNLEDQLEFLSPNWPPRTREMITGLKTLGDQLGDGHDLVLLKEFETKQCARCKETENLFRLIDSRRQEFEGLALKLGVRIFGDRPKKACERFEEDWKEWRHNK